MRLPALLGSGFHIVRVPGIVRVNFRDTYPHYIGLPIVVFKVVSSMRYRVSSGKWLRPGNENER